MFDHAISGYRHKVTFFKTPGDLWMLKGTSPNVCLTIAPNYRLQNEIPTIESSGNVITRRFVGPLLRRYCAPTTKTPGANKAKARNLICEGRAIGCTPCSSDLSGDVMRKADDTSSADDVRRQADDGRKTAAAAVRYDVTTRRDDSYYRRQDDTQPQCFSTGCGGVRCGGGPEGWPRLPWHVGRVYSGDSLILVPDRSRLSPLKERTQSSLTVSQFHTKQVTTTTRARTIQQPMKSHVEKNLPVLYGNVNSRAFAIGEKKHIGQVEHEPKLIGSFTKEETGSNSELRLHSRLDNIQNSFVVCRLHPPKTRSGPTVAKSPDVLDRAANNTPEDGVHTLAADQKCEATRGEAEQTISGIRDSSGQCIASQEQCRKVTVQSISEPNATFLWKDHVVDKTMEVRSEDQVQQL